MTLRNSLVNDGSHDAPRLRIYMNLGTVAGLGSDSSLRPHERDGTALYERLLAEGFDGVQLTDGAPLRGAPLPHCGSDRINSPQEADSVVARHAAQGDECITVHAGWGMEEDKQIFDLVEAILKASDKHRLPVFLETHRATVTQDIWRTVQITRMFPEVRFNADFSHYYCGQELVYGEWEEKLTFLRPVFDRVGFIHGRIASSGCMQVPIDADLTARPLQAHGRINYLEHFRELWTEAMAGFLRMAGPGDCLIFAPELLSSEHYYARMFPADGTGCLVEECDRFAQALLYKELAAQCFAEAQKNVEQKSR